ncbi:MAG: Fic family protein [Nitrosomonas oligotropha]|uniref:Fic family protein n=1 Tax=Nitrosomonas oligotropha TaxID=42354 RepID=A0A5C7W0Y9_9PROT|nr:MAG: Fic family protein [Nitrosomonas oligotropha]
MNRYIHELPNWPGFSWDHAKLSGLLASVRHRQGRLIGRMEAMGFPLTAQATLQNLTLDVLKSSEIEGAILNRDQVRSSIALRLGLDIGALAPADRHVDGIVDMMLDATQNYAQPLSVDRLFGWHAALFPAGFSGMHKIRTGQWRDDANGPMQVVSGALGKERVHFEAPAAERLEQEINLFLTWFNDKNDTDAVLKAGIAHLWFVTLHPFEDGNGRMARAIADMALAQSEQSPQRYYSLSAQIRQERKAYYDMLEKTQKSDLDITPWLEWFLNCLDRAISNTEETLGDVLYKARFLQTHKNASLNDRQRIMLNKVLDGFEGKLTSSKWAKLAKCSQDTALRDILDLIERGILLKDVGGGRSTSYSLKDVSNVGDQ